MVNRRMWRHIEKGSWAKHEQNMLNMATDDWSCSLFHQAITLFYCLKMPHRYVVYGCSNTKSLHEGIALHRIPYAKDTRPEAKRKGKHAVDVTKTRPRLFARNILNKILLIGLSASFPVLSLWLWLLDWKATRLGYPLCVCPSKYQDETNILPQSAQCIGYSSSSYCVNNQNGGRHASYNWNFSRTKKYMRIKFPIIFLSKR